MREKHKGRRQRRGCINRFEGCLERKKNMFEWSNRRSGFVGVGLGVGVGDCDLRYFSFVGFYSCSFSFFLASYYTIV